MTSGARSNDYYGSKVNSNQHQHFAQDDYHLPGWRQALASAFDMPLFEGPPPASNAQDKLGSQVLQVLSISTALGLHSSMLKLCVYLVAGSLAAKGISLQLCHFS